MRVVVLLITNEEDEARLSLDAASVLAQSPISLGSAGLLLIFSLAKRLFLRFKRNISN